LITLSCGAIAFPNVEAIVFDKDGTLADALPYLTQLAQQRIALINAQVPTVEVSLAQAFGLEGRCLDPGGLMAVGTRRENEMAAATCVAATGRAWFEALTLVQAAFRQADRSLQPKAHYTPPFAGSRALLSRCANAGLKLAILSSDTRDNVAAFVERYHLEGVQVIVGADSERSKPDPVLLQQVCDRLGVPVKAALMVGDATVDIVMAQAAGALGSVGVTWGGASRDALKAASAIVSHMQELQFNLVT
jgi:phosphoglycolate phosphatase